MTLPQTESGYLPSLQGEPGIYSQASELVPPAFKFLLSKMMESRTTDEVVLENPTDRPCRIPRSRPLHLGDDLIP